MITLTRTFDGADIEVNPAVIAMIEPGLNGRGAILNMIGFDGAYHVQEEPADIRARMARAEEVSAELTVIEAPFVLDPVKVLDSLNLALVSIMQPILNVSENTERLADSLVRIGDCLENIEDHASAMGDTLEGIVHAIKEASGQS